MLTVRFIRHAESAANAGAASAAPDSIPLSPLGVAQAEALAATVPEAPSLIICSPYQRTRFTAAHVIQRHAQAPLQTWPVQEFTYLAPARHAGTTALQRRPHVLQYWERCDPGFCDGPGAESFATFMARVHAALDRLAALGGEAGRNVLVFSHGQFMKALHWSLLRQPARIDAAAMRDFRAFDLAHAVPNTGGFTLTGTAGEWRLPAA